MQTFTIIHARTLNNDFPAGLLVYPNNFSHEKVMWARDYITNSTRFIELVSPQGRRVIFADNSTLITGISINIKDLYKLCDREPKYANVETTRTNYAFIGFAIPKSEISYAFDVPYSLFLEQYEKYMEKLWHTEFQETGLSCTMSDYYNIDFPAAKEVFSFPLISTTDKTVIDEKTTNVESICAGVTMIIKDHNDIGFCSDVPNAKCVIESKFSIVSAKDAKRIQDNLQSKSVTEELPKSKPHTFRSGKTNEEKSGKKFDNIFDNIKQGWKNSSPQKKASMVGIGTAVIGVIVKIGDIAIHFISGSKD